MMNNHFFIAYCGNKRTEVKEIYKALYKYNIDNIETIIEPFCGSSAMSYYISTLHPLKFKYILNDNNKHLIELYKIYSDDTLLKSFIENINNICFDKDLKFMTKDDYVKFCKMDTVESYFIKNKFYSIKPGLYPNPLRLLSTKKNNISYEKIIKTPIINFLRTENITFECLDAIKIIKNYNNKSNLILCDPPYLNVDNFCYENPTTDIYKWLEENNKLLYNTVFILEYNETIKLLFREVENLTIYTKKYTGFKKKIVEHVIAIYNSPS